MRCTKSVITGIVAAAACASPALAQPDYGDSLATRADALPTMSLVGFAGAVWQSLNTGGHVPIPRSALNSPEFHSIGQNTVPDGQNPDTVEAAWYEFMNDDGRFIQFIVRTRNRSAFVPFGTTLGGNTVQAWSYEMGGEGSGVEWANWVTSVVWEKLIVSYDTDWGESPFSDPAINFPIGGGHWDGTDTLHEGLGIPGDGINWLQVTYGIDAVPAAPTLLAFAGAGLLASRRRRS